MTKKYLSSTGLTFGELIKSRRENLGFSQSRLAELVNNNVGKTYSKSSIWKWENTNTKPPAEVVEYLEDELHIQGGALLDLAGYSSDAEIRRSGNNSNLNKDESKSTRHERLTLTHDARIFTETDEILPEQRLKDYLNYIDQNTRYCTSQSSAFKKLIDYFKLESNQYIDQKLRNAYSNLQRSIKDLLDFICFYNELDEVLPNGEMRYRLLSISQWEDRNIFTQRIGKITSLLNSVEDNYNVYRRVVREVLML